MKIAEIADSVKNIDIPVAEIETLLFNGLPVVFGYLSLLFIAVLTICAGLVIYEEVKNDKKGA